MFTVSRNIANSFNVEICHIPLRILRRNVNTSIFTPLIFNISSVGYTRQAFIKIKNPGNENTCDLYLIQIYFLTKYLVENAENSICETLDFKTPLVTKSTFATSPSSRPVRSIIIHLVYCLTRMARKYNVFKDSVTTLAEIIPSYYMGEGFSSEKNHLNGFFCNTQCTIT